MLAFVTTIRHPQNAKSYARIGRLLDRTLASVCRQTDEEFVVLVVHNNPPPATAFVDHRVHFVPVDFPPPGDGRAHALGYGDLLLDKGSKSAVGITVARSLGASHVAFFDADDLIHRELAGFVNRRPATPGWYSPTGYIYTDGARHVQWISEGFNNKNGSTNIVRINLTGVCGQITSSSTQTEVIEALGSALGLRVIGQHATWPRAMEEMGHPMEELPIPSAVWVIGTGENHSGNIVSARARRVIDSQVTEAFGLVAPGYATAARTAVRTLLWRTSRRLTK